MDKVEHNFIVGFEHRNHGRTLFHDGKNLAVDYNRPLTLSRCKDILLKARELTGQELTIIEMHHAIYSKTEGNECGDYPEECFLNKKYIYGFPANSLIIKDGDEVVYINEDGKILRGDDANIAYCDSLDV